jgi:hypothetical protein
MVKGQESPTEETKKVGGVTARRWPKRSRVWRGRMAKGIFLRQR